MNQVNGPPPSRVERQGIQFTGIVVTYNEARRLRDCLNSLSFCDQLIVVDLGSRDGSAEIASECGAEVVPHEWVPAVEYVWPDAVLLARTDWVVLLDPDEAFPSSLHEEVVRLISRSEKAAQVRVPYQFYFLGEPLRTTRWGGAKLIGKVVHRKRVTISPRVHRSMSVGDGYEQVSCNWTSRNAIRHYWVDGLKQLFRKHLRYLEHEGKSRYLAGHRFSWLGWVTETAKAFVHSLIRRRGLLGGLSGIFLSTFWAWYVCMSLLSLRRYQTAITRGRHTA